MNIEDFREYCLSFRGVRERMPFEKASSPYDRNLLVFYAGGKWFCFVNIDSFDFCTIKCDPSRIEELQAEYEGIKPPYHMNKRHWISVYFSSDVPDKMVKELVRRSYDLVAPPLPEKENREM